MNRDYEIFADAIDLPVTERAAFLEQACGSDAVLRARVEALLAGHDAAANFLEESPAGRPAPKSEEKIGDVIGHYTLLRKIGDGGCGVVYLAEQKQPVRRLVALKVIKLGMDTRNVIARFEAERQALAMMDHPDIARVFDAGTTDAGRPFFAMEFVDGIPITKFCDEHSLSMPARLELFARVCLALQHAHQKGIIHRDVKPSNILVAMHDGVPTPKVIDFGIAKATQGRLTDLTLVTGFDQFIGTPTYMSPEQAELRDLDIDTRSDVYSLGVLLYELLTGHPPYDSQSLVRAGIDEIRRIIREVDPPRPSTRILTLTDADRETVARLRRAAPMQLTSVLRGDLDWIVMRCLEKDRARRYNTAHELADDVRRHLRQEPVAARPPSAGYRLQKFFARNRLACVSAAAVALALIVGTVVSVRQAVRATRAESVARTQRDAATAAGRAEAVARADAQRRQEQAEDLLTFMLGDFRAELQKAGRLNLLEGVGDKAMAYFSALNSRDLTDTALARQSKALTQIGEVRMDQARYPEAAVAFNTAYDRAAALAARHPQGGDMLFERAQAEYWIAFAAHRRGDFAAERDWFTRYRDSAIALAALEGKSPRAQMEIVHGHHNLAILELDRRNLTDALNGFLAERTVVNEMLVTASGNQELQFKMADIASWLGSIAECDGKYNDAVDYFQEMSARYAELSAQEPATARWKVQLAQSATFSGGTQALQGRKAEAAVSYEKAENLFEELVARDPKNRQWLAFSLWLRLQQAALMIAQDDLPAVDKILTEIRPKLETLVAAEPTSHAFTRNLTSMHRLEGRIRFAAQRPDAGEPVVRAIELGAKLIQESRADNWTITEFAQACILAGRIHFAAGRTDEARRYWEKAVETLLPRVKNSNDWRFLDPAAQALVLLGKSGEARPLIEKLQHFGYRAVDPLAASTLATAFSSDSSQQQK
jgi:serine/threonine protein kinase/tetratricopeptide (TPR) repeat protein